MSTLGFREENKIRAAYAVGVGGAREEGFEVVLPRLFVLGKKFQDPMYEPSQTLKSPVREIRMRGSVGGLPPVYPISRR